MKKLFSLLSLSIFATCLYAQAPLFSKYIISDISPLSTKVAATGIDLHGTINGKLIYTASIFKKDSAGKLKSFRVLKADSTELLSSEHEARVYLGILNNEMYFVRNGVGLPSLSGIWKTDGTLAGTLQVSDSTINVLSFVSPAGGWCYFYNNKLYFVADDGVHGYELWMTDGTTAGTQMAADIIPGPDRSYPREFIEYDGKLYFSAYYGTGGNALYSIDGTTGNFQVVKIFSAGTGMSWPHVLNDKFCFICTDTSGAEPWISDGTDTGTHILKETYPGAGGGLYPESDEDSFFTEYKGKLYFSVLNQFWCTDGTSAGTVKVKNVASLHRRYVFNGLMYMMGGKSNGIVFTADTGLWVSDGTEAGTRLLSASLLPDIKSKWPCFETYNGDLYFTRPYADKFDMQVWKTDGTAAGTERIMPVYKRGALELRSELMSFDGALFFPANYDTSAGQLWSFRGFPTSVSNTTNTPGIFNLHPNPASSYCTIKTQQAYNKGNVTVYDVAGRMILRKNITGDTNNIQLKGMPKGIYTVTITLDDRTAAQQLVVE